MNRFKTNSKTTTPLNARRGGRRRIHEDAAARQRAYRARLRDRGLRVVNRIVRDVRPPQPLESDVIDLSAVEPFNRANKR
jgi:hypothetical protein